MQTNHRHIHLSLSDLFSLFLTCCYSRCPKMYLYECNFTQTEENIMFVRNNFNYQIKLDLVLKRVSGAVGWDICTR